MVIQGVSEKVCFFKSAPYYRIMCPKVISSQKVIEMRQIWTLFLLKDLHGRLLGRFKAHLLSKNSHFCPKNLSFYIYAIYLHFWTPTEFSKINTSSPYGHIPSHLWVTLDFLQNDVWPILPKITLFGAKTCVFGLSIQFRTHHPKEFFNVMPEHQKDILF